MASKDMGTAGTFKPAPVSQPIQGGKPSSGPADTGKANEGVHVDGIGGTNPGAH